MLRLGPSRPNARVTGKVQRRRSGGGGQAAAGRLRRKLFSASSSSSWDWPSSASRRSRNSMAPEDRGIPVPRAHQAMVADASRPGGARQVVPGEIRRRSRRHAHMAPSTAPPSPQPLRGVPGQRQQGSTPAATRPPGHGHKPTGPSTTRRMRCGCAARSRPRPPRPPPSRGSAGHPGQHGADRAGRENGFPPAPDPPPPPSARRESSPNSSHPGRRSAGSPGSPGHGRRCARSSAGGRRRPGPAPR